MHTYFVYNARCYPEPFLFVAGGQCLRELVVLQPHNVIAVVELEQGQLHRAVRILDRVVPRGARLLDLAPQHRRRQCAQRVLVRRPRVRVADRSVDDAGVR